MSEAGLSAEEAFKIGEERRREVWAAADEVVNAWPGAVDLTALAGPIGRLGKALRGYDRIAYVIAAHVAEIIARSQDEQGPADG